jgi:hypothetical protein
LPRFFSLPVSSNSVCPYFWKHFYNKVLVVLFQRAISAFVGCLFSVQIKIFLVFHRMIINFGSIPEYLENHVMKF